MKLGASTSCYYPLETELALDKVIAGGFSCTEIFFNTYSELQPDFVSMLAEKAERAGLEVVSVHPFSSFAETTCLFGNYDRRADDFLQLYERYFQACNVLGAKLVVLHGALLQSKTFVPEERYIERFCRLADIGKRYGVTLAQENVNRHFSENPAFLLKLKYALGSDFKLVLDIKQALRAGFDPFEFVRLFGRDIVHLHISDHDDEKDCIPPGKGRFDFERLVREMNAFDYKGCYMMEIYRDDYRVSEELAQSAAFLKGIQK